MEQNDITAEIIDAAMKVHTALGPGLLESVYEACLIYELKKRSLALESQISIPIIYDSVRINAGFRLDILVEKTVIIELKAVENILPVHEAQLLSYLKLSGKKIGLLINFNVVHLKNGIRRMIY
jgi:GxxExxY protein